MESTHVLELLIPSGSLSEGKAVLAVSKCMERQKILHGFDVSPEARYEVVRSINHELNAALTMIQEMGRVLLDEIGEGYKSDEVEGLW
jgi:hypothetical protein